MRPDEVLERALAVTHAKHRVVDVGGAATSILEAGEGPPLLLVHGGVESGAAVWTPVLDNGTFAVWLRGTMQPSSTSSGRSWAAAD